MKPKTLRGTCLTSTWLVVMVLYFSLARARFGRVRCQPSSSSPQSTVTPFHPLTSVVPFSISPLVPLWCQSLLSSIPSTRHCCMPFCALPTRVGPISPSDHPGEPATPAALPPPSLVVEAVAAARASMVIRAVVAAGAPPLALAVQRGAAVTACLLYTSDAADE